jgi:pyruvate dehydrogenase E2 component (dihydrolipoamide acetyltransferase)
MPALEMAQESGKLVRWLKHEGDLVSKGEPIMEIETDKVTVEIEAAASGTLSQVQAAEGDVIPVGQPIAWIVAPGERLPTAEPAVQRESILAPLTVSPLARKIAEEHGISPSVVAHSGGRITKDDVLAYLANTSTSSPAASFSTHSGHQSQSKIPASPKARRLAAERGVELATLSGSGPDGAVLVKDLPLQIDAPAPVAAPLPVETEPLSTVWRVMAERMTASWNSAPHFYLVREVKAAALVEMRRRISPAVEKRVGIQPTYTDIFIKLIAITLRDHPRLNATWAGNAIEHNKAINIGLAVGIEDGLIVPVIPNADSLSLGELAVCRRDVVERANGRRLRPGDLANGTFTLTNLGMYNVDAFMPILNPPQAAILAIGRIADRVVPENGLPVVRPMVILTLVCDHRVADGVRGAKFFDDLSNLIEEPWGVLA